MNVYALIDVRDESARCLLGVYGSEARAQAEIDQCRADGFPNTALWWTIEPVEVDE